MDLPADMLVQGRCFAEVLGSNVHPVRCHGGSFYAKENERAEVLSLSWY